MRIRAKVISAVVSGMLIMGALPLAAFAEEEATGLVTRVSSAETQVMYRAYNPNSGEHFYTKDENELNSLVSVGWNDEGIGRIAPRSSSTPVYRLYSGTDHHYCTSDAERKMLIGEGWFDEGIGWYSDDAQTVPLYRQFNPNVQPWAPTNNSGSHNYTTNKAEHDHLVSNGWNGEGIGWYAVAEGQPAAPAGSSTPATITPGYAEAKIQAFFKKYPEGTPWTDENRTYVAKGTPDNYFLTTSGCAAYAYMLQDEIYGDRPYIESDDPSTVKPYDIVWTGYHWMFVHSIDRAKGTMTLAEGNFNSAVHIGRTISLTNNDIIKVVSR